MNKEAAVFFLLILYGISYTGTVIELARDWSFPSNVETMELKNNINCVSGYFSVKGNISYCTLMKHLQH